MFKCKYAKVQGGAEDNVLDEVEDTQRSEDIPMA